MPSNKTKHKAAQLLLVNLLLWLPACVLAQTCTVVSSGNWTLASTWSCNRPPADGDKVIIPLGKTVTVDAVTSTLNIDMDIYGTLNFASGGLFTPKSMTIAMGRTIHIYPTGIITGGNGLSSLYMVTGYLLVVPLTQQIYSGLGSPISGPRTCLLGTCLLNASLPIDLLSFTARYESSQRVIRLEWITLSETQNETFRVEKSTDGLNFSPVVELPGAGNTHQKRLYQALDERAADGINYYRLRQTDYDGTSTYSKVVAVHQPTNKQFSADVSPNPSNGSSLRIGLSGSSESEVSVLIYDHLGYLVHQQRDAAQGKVISVAFDRALANGMYWIKIRQDESEITRKWLVLSH